jgi:hypothetical protein
MCGPSPMPLDQVTLSLPKHRNLLDKLVSLNSK